MKILIIGAHGHVGQLTTKLLADQGNQVYGGIRDTAQNDEIKTLGGIPVTYDLLGSVAEMTKTIADIKPDAIVFTAGSGGHGGQSGTLNIDLDGAVKTMEAAQQAAVKRFIMVSAFGTGDREFWANSSIRGYYVAKYYADQWLQLRTNLQYTILRPGTLTNDEPTGEINLSGATTGDLTVTRADVAAVIAAVLDNSQTIGEIYTFVNGDEPIDEAF